MLDSFTSSLVVLIKVAKSASSSVEKSFSATSKCGAGRTTAITKSQTRWRPHATGALKRGKTRA